MTKKKIGNLAVILTIVAMVVGATWKVSDSFKDLELEMNKQKNELKQLDKSIKDLIIHIHIVT